MASMDLLFRFLGVDAGAGREFDRMAGKASATGSVMSKMAFGAAAAAGTVAIASIKMASTFQTSTARLSTQADVSAKNLKVLSNGMLGMAGAVATTPNVLAQAAYHIASVGQTSMTTAQELRILKVATEGAKIGGADLVDVTNTLDALLISHLKGVKNYSQAMGVLNSVVGAGDMQMQDLSEALGPLGSTFKGFGVSIQQAGAALAVFGDNGIRGQLAGSQLRQSITALADPLKAGRTQLEAWGISSGTLSKQLAKGGLTSALEVLSTKLHKAGYTASTMGPILAEMFGKRGPQQGLSTLINQMGRYQDKLGEVTQGGNHFASSWKGYTKTFGYAWDSAKASAEAMLIQLGTKLLPTATKVTDWIAKTAIPDLTRFAHWLAENSRWTKPLAIGLGVAASALLLFVGPITATIAGLTGLGIGLVEAYKHSQTFRDVVQTAGRIALATFDALRSGAITLWRVMDTAWHGIDDAWRAFVAGPVAYVRERLASFAQFWHSHLTEIRQVAHIAWTAIKTTIKVQWDAAMMFIRPELTVLKAAFRTAFDVVKNVVSTAFRVVGDVLKTAQGLIQSFVGVVLDLITGHWAKAWGDAKKFVSTAINGVGRILADFAKGAVTLLYQAGKDIISGLVNGIKSGVSSVLHTVSSLAGSIKHAFTHPLSILSPSKVFYGYGGNIVEGLNNGIKSKIITAKSVAHLLAEGLIGGWTGMAGSLKNALGTPVENALNAVQKAIESAIAKQKATLSKATSAYKSALSSVRADQQSTAGGVDLSSIFGTDANGNPTMGSAVGYLASQAPLVTQFAADIKKAAALHLAPALLSQIEGMGFVQGDQVLRQLLAGGKATISQANTAERTIQSGARSAAGSVFDASHPRETLSILKSQERIAQRTLETMQHNTAVLERMEAKAVAGHTTFTIDGKTVHLKDEDAKTIVKILHKYERQTGRKLLMS